jgi:hypothetical protein
MKKLSPNVMLVVAGVLSLVILGLGWFVLVSPQRSKGSSLDQKIAATQSQLLADQHVLTAYDPKKARATLAAAVRALPEQEGMSQILRQVSAAIAKSKTQIQQLSPQPLAIGPNGAQAVTMTLNVTGRYFAIQRLLRILRQSADLDRKGDVTGHGRLYTVDGIQFSQGGSTATAGLLQAAITLDAFVYTPGAAPAPPASASGSTDTTAAAPTN